MLGPGFQLFDDARNRRLPAARDRELLGDRGQLPLAQRVLPDGLIAADNCGQFPARPFQDVDDAVGLVEVVTQVLPRMCTASDGLYFARALNRPPQ